MKLAVYINAPDPSTDDRRREYPAFASSALAHGLGELAARLYDMGYSRVVLDMGLETRAYAFDGPTPQGPELGKVAPKVLQISPLRPPGRRPADGWYSYGIHANRFPRPEKLSLQDVTHIKRAGGVVLSFYTETHQPLGTQRFIVPSGHIRVMATEALKQAEIPEGAAYVMAWIDPRSLFPSYFMLIEDWQALT